MPYTAAQLTAFYTAAHAGMAPSTATAQTLAALAAQTQTGVLSDQAALNFVINSADNDTAVANLTYQYFTGKSVSAAGLAYLVSSATNTTDLNDPYYLNFNPENRYINFATNLGVFGEGATAFATNYGALTFEQYVTIAYEQVIGSAYATAAGLNPTAAIADIQARKAYFTNLAVQNLPTGTAAQRDLAAKAGVLGYIMSEGMKADVGIYAAAQNNFSQALINGTATYNVDLVTTYAILGGGTGNPSGGGGGPVPTGLTLTTTTNLDALVGGAGNDTIIGDNTTVQAADSYNGGGGLDTFRYFANTAVVPVLTNIEALNLVNSAADIDVSGQASLTHVVLDGTPTADRTVTVSNAVNVGVLNQTTAKTDTFTFTGTTATTGNATISASTITDLNLNNAKFTTLALKVTGTAASTIADLKSTGTETKVDVTGDKALTITTALETSVVTLDSSASTGGLTAGLKGATSAVTGGTGAEVIDVSAVTAGGKQVVNLGAGNDTLIYGGNAIAAGNTFAGGDGTDTIRITDGAKITGVTGAQITAFETLGTGTGTGTYDPTLIAGITGVAVDGVLAGAVSFINLTTQTVTISAAAGKDTTFALKDASGAKDALTINIAGVTASKVITTGIETLTLNSSGKAAATVTDLNLTGTSKLVVTGAQGLTVTTSADAALTEINASAMTGTKAGNGFAMTAALTDDHSVTFIGGAGADTFFGNGKGDNFRGNGGGDIFKLTAAGKADSFIYTAASDSQITATSAAGMDLIDNVGGIKFTANEDVIDLTGFGFTGFARGVKSVGALVGVETTVSRVDLFDVGGSDRAVATATEGGNTYIFVDVNKNGDFDAAGDMVIRINGAVVLSNNEFAF